MPALVNVESGTDVWERAFDVPATDLFAVQSDIAGEVADQLKITLGPATQTALSQRPSRSLDAYDAYLRARALDRRGEVLATRRQAAAMYLEAVRLDSTFGAAWASLSKDHALMYARGGGAPGDADTARLAAARSRATAPSLPEAFDAEALYYSLVQHNDAQAVALYRTALRANPRSPLLLIGITEPEMTLGQWDSAAAHMDEAAQLDPRWAYPPLITGEINLIRRRFGAARSSYERALALDSTNMTAVERLAVLPVFEHGDLAGTRAALRRALVTVDSAALLATVTYEHGWWLLDSAQQSYLLRLPFDAFDSPGIGAAARAGVYALRGDRVRARAYADTARIAVEASLATSPTNSTLHQIHALALAALGRDSAAVGEGRRAVELLPVERDAWGGPSAVLVLAQVYGTLGRDNEALDLIQSLVTMPSDVSSAGSLRVDPAFARLHGNPRFERLTSAGGRGG